jgi:hypothetical protein
MKKFALALIGLSMVWACNNAPAEEEVSTETTEASAALRKEVMELHDKVMPEMTPMLNLANELTQASVGKADSIDYITTATELRYAKEAMMTWMREFSGNFQDSWTEEEKIAFFKNEKAKMERIDQKTQEALAAGRDLMATLNEAAPAGDSASTEE